MRYISYVFWLLLFRFLACCGLLPKFQKASDGEFTEDEKQRYFCIGLGFECHGPPVGSEYLHALVELYGSLGASCAQRGLFECIGRRPHLNFAGWLTYPGIQLGRDRYFTLRQMRYKSADLDTLQWCLFFRRARIIGNNLEPFDTCQVCSGSELYYYTEPRCNLGGVWRRHGFAGVENSIHHNFGVLSESLSDTSTSKKVLAFGGRYPGIWRLEAELPSNTMHGSSGSVHEWKLDHHVEISRYHTGCIDFLEWQEAQDSGVGWSCRYPNCGCALDGRLSAVRFKGEILLYARANVRPQGGGRFVQVTRGRDMQNSTAKLSWSPFELIRVIDYDMYGGDIYFFSVHVNPVATDMLLALFPVLDRGNNRSSIAISFSDDGVWWSPIVDLVSSPPSLPGRTSDHSVDGMTILGSEVIFYIHKGLPPRGFDQAKDAGLYWQEQVSNRTVIKKNMVQKGLKRYSMTKNKLSEMTSEARARLIADRDSYPEEIPNARAFKDIVDDTVQSRSGMEVGSTSEDLCQKFALSEIVADTLPNSQSNFAKEAPDGDAIVAECQVPLKDRLDFGVVNFFRETSPSAGASLAKRLYLFSQLKQLVVDRQIPGSFLELGCYHGKRTSLHIRRFIDFFDPTREFHVYDSFQGLPRRAGQDGPAVSEEDDQGGMAASLDAFETNFKAVGLRLPDRIHVGFFDSIPDDEFPAQVAFAFLDGLLYQSIKDSLSKVYSKLVTGAVIVVHDYMNHGRFPGPKKAIEEFFADKSEAVVECWDFFALIVKATV